LDHEGTITLPSDKASLKHYSYYSHPSFIRGQRDLVRFMIRCKVKGTGKKRADDHLEDLHHGYDYPSIFYENDDDDVTYGEPQEADDDDHSVQDKKKGVSSTEGWNCDSNVSLPFPEEVAIGNGGNGDGIFLESQDECTLVDTKDESSVGDGDVLYFEGSPFHFLDPMKGSSSVPASVIPFMLPISTHQQNEINSRDVATRVKEEEMESNNCGSNLQQYCDSSVMVDPSYNCYQPTQPRMSPDPDTSMASLYRTSNIERRMILDPNPSSILERDYYYEPMLSTSSSFIGTKPHRSNHPSTSLLTMQYNNLSAVANPTSQSWLAYETTTTHPPRTYHPTRTAAV
jgi:hypothetical protein